MPYDGPIVTRQDAIAAGLKRYFTGRACKRGHLSERALPKSECATCKLNGRADSYASNIQDNRAAASKWYHENLERGREYRRNYARSHPEETKLRCAAWYLDNKDRAKVNNDIWKTNNKDKVNAFTKRWRDANPEASRAIVRNRRARSKLAEGSHKAADIISIASRQKYKCAGCKISIRAGWHVDHIQPLSRGGSNYPRNLQLLCRDCNLRKHAKHPIVWAQENGRLL